MRSHRTFSATISSLSLLFLLFFALNCQAGSMTSWHQFKNGTNGEILITLYEGYPVNQVYSKKLKPGEIFDIKDEIDKPGYFYLITVVKSRGTPDEVVYRKMLTWKEYVDALQEDKVDGFHITEERLKTWERDPK